MTSLTRKKLNLGCGHRFLPSWVNVDHVAQAPGVIAHDLRTPLPYADEYFAVVYHSHVLEHLAPANGLALLQECRRVLAPGGTIRIVVPDLETKAALYVEKLRAAAAGGALSAAEHEWMIIELLDQMVRRETGGEMVKFLQSGRATAFVRQRIGDEYDRARSASPAVSSARVRRVTGVRSAMRRLAQSVLGISDAELDYLKFRRIGELHLWMYDRVSLARTLIEAGFTQVQQESAATSRITDWQQDGVYLDVEGGEPRKPDSVYVEAIRA
jgi:predicted SAM-dependent methyltransferase